MERKVFVTRKQYTDGECIVIEMPKKKALQLFVLLMSQTGVDIRDQDKHGIVEDVFTQLAEIIERNA